MAAVLDLDFMPLLFMSYVDRTTDEEFGDFLHKVAATLYGPNVRRRAVILDTRYGQTVSATQRRMQANWMKEHEAALREHTVGMAFVIDSALTRGVLTAILWLQPMPMPHEVCATVEQAVAWAGNKLEERGVDLSGVTRLAAQKRYEGLNRRGSNAAR